MTGHHPAADLADRYGKTDRTDAAGPIALQAHFSVLRSRFAVEVDLAVTAGESVAVLGPNGAGKSTLLAVLAGLLPPDRGTVCSHGRVLTRRSVPGERDLQVPPEHRRVGLLGQEPLLFPHLTAAENVAFGPRAQHHAHSRADRAAREWLDRVGLADFAGRKPGQLSGGQRQRVALARALAAEPDVMLLDEPLAGLDVGSAPEIRQTLRTHLRDRGVTTVLVTHDALDAAVLTDRAVVLQHGRITESGPTGRLLSRPKSAFGALLAGLNLLGGQVQARQPHPSGLAMVTVRVGPETLITGLSDEVLGPGEPASVLFGPAAIQVGGTWAGGAAAGAVGANFWRAHVADLQAVPSAVRLLVDAPFEAMVDVGAAVVADLDLRPGQTVPMSIDADRVRIYRQSA